jgi:hypothetical protein
MTVFFEVKWMRTLLAILLLLFSLQTLPAAAQAGTVESLGPPAAPEISEAVKKVLSGTGYRITLDDGKVWCEIWLRRNVPTQAAKNAPEVVYPELAESTLVGVISFPQAGADYRGQAVKAGVYTLRYALLPNDGNHMGVAPNRDFLLLIPAAADPDPNTSYPVSELTDLSRRSTGSRHPAPLSLVESDGSTTPAVSRDDEEHWIFSAALQRASGQELPIALIVKGTAPQ